MALRADKLCGLELHEIAFGEQLKDERPASTDTQIMRQQIEPIGQERQEHQVWSED